ncbi:PLP-dependent aminotransferase family protein [Dyadobacter sp. CY327]|uniref:aminotransferase-like domain-containing protein n=1 Tax=Dyadobacter sp. CY327 TaxID=2907301 RepID=UPI001F3550E8|nr:PLP-dependent aminotransferase family protein [Dyadobacter sp. CY327]MCE7070523.1 PLP-dependent aminotransferase family protein [Dyadobacter sp. CY327]
MIFVPETNAGAQTPMSMLPFKTLIKIDRTGHPAVYIQLANGLINLIRDGKIIPGTFLPGTREMARIIQIHRKTVINAYDELATQGWIESLPQKGFRVVPDLPVVKPRTYHPKSNFSQPISLTEDLLQLPVLVRPGWVSEPTDGAIIVDDGFPDPLLSPHESFLQQYRQLLRSKEQYQISLHIDRGGVPHLKSATSTFLNRSRGLNITDEHLIITRGAQMAIYMAAALLIRPGDNIVVSDPSYFIADFIFQKLGAVIHRVAVDQEGMDVNQLEDLLKTKQFRMLYVIPHHHHPTTVTMSSSRRIQLLNVIKQYGLWTIEDDYDYDFHYRNSPILPLASADHGGRIIYIGSYTKLLGPSFRIGYMVAEKHFINQAIRFKRLIDIRGDFMMESALANLIENGELGRHIRRSKKIYADRLESASKLIADPFAESIYFEKPQGGMALWLRFDNRYPLAQILVKASARNLHFQGSAYFEGHIANLNSLRFGFASLSEDRMGQAISIMREILR